MTWFARALQWEMDRNRWTQTELADFLGERQSTVNRWLGGSMPDPDKQEAIIQRLGGDISRALPSYDPVRDALEIAEREVGHVKVTGPLILNSDQRSLLVRYVDAIERRSKEAGPAPDVKQKLLSDLEEVAKYLRGES